MQINTMHAEAARCFRIACETDDPLERTLYMGLRQAWLVLACQADQCAGDQPRSIEEKCASGTERADKGNRVGKPNRRTRYKEESLAEAKASSRQVGGLGEFSARSGSIAKMPASVQ